MRGTTGLLGEHESMSAEKLPARYAIQQDQRSARAEDAIYPTQPSLVKSHVFHYLQHQRMFNRIECLGEVEFEQHSNAHARQSRIVLERRNPY